MTRQIAEDFALSCESAVIKGDGQGKPHGLMRGGTVVELKSTGAITADELIRIQGSLKAPMNYGASWIMSRETLLAVRMLKDKNGNYLFHEGDLQDGFRNFYVLGKPVAISEAMVNFEVLYGNFGKGYIGNVRPEMSITVSRSTQASFATTLKFLSRQKAAAISVRWQAKALHHRFVQRTRRCNPKHHHRRTGKTPRGRN